MKSPIERVLIYLLGGALGAACAFIITSFHVNFLQKISKNTVVFICIVLGILISVSMVAYTQYLVRKRNTKIKDETVTLITHEMRTSLTSCGWMIGSILKKYSAHIDQTDIQALQNLVESIHTTVMHSVNLLDVSLLEIHKLDIALTFEKLTKVEEMFREVLEKYTIGAEQQGLALQYAIHLDGDREVEVDLLRLRIVLENLLENAIQYSNKNTHQTPLPSIDVSVESKDNTLYIQVSDHGIGIPENEQSKIFSQFYRAHNARKALSTGSGIGLYTSATYMKAHRGTIDFKSIEGKGTTFFVTVPLKTAADVSNFVRTI